MGGIFNFVRYLRLKSLVSVLRLALKLLAPAPKAKPDDVLRIPSRDQRSTIKAHVYKPPAAAPNGGSGAPYPALINFHGSGFAVPLHGTDDEFCRHVATMAGYVVLDIEYRLGPEHPFPAAVHDVEDAAKYVLSRQEEYRASEVSVSGFSSGGTLALVAPTLFPHGTFQSVIAFYPATNLAMDPSLRNTAIQGAKRRGSFWTRIFRAGYIGENDPRDPRISPAYADTTNYPDRILVVTAELDTSALEAEELAEKAKTEGQVTGRHVVVQRMKDCNHAFDKKSKPDHIVQAKNEAYGLAVDMLRGVMNKGG